MCGYTCVQIMHGNFIKLPKKSRCWVIIIYADLPNFKGSLVEPPLKLRHGWVITFYRKYWARLLIHAQTAVNIY